MTDESLLQIIQSLTLEEKASLCSGIDSWQTVAIPEKGVPSLRMADGPHGVRLEDKAHEKATGHHSHPATCFPPEVALACSWSPELTRRVGEAIAEECRHYGVQMILGPGVNIKRSPLGGRNFEYLSEDPILAGKLAAGYIGGVQGKGVATSLKHYAANNQEHKRMSINACVDERALFDLYLKPFEIAVAEAQPATVMCSYNRLNGAYASEHRRLLTDILRLRFGFRGAVVSDWGAVNDRAKGVAAGLDLEMPSTGGVNDAAIVAAVKNGALPEDALDTVCWNLLRLVFTYTENAPQEGREPCDFPAHHVLASQALEQSAVLLKNDGMLPLAKEGSLAVIGEMAQKPRYQGGGSSVINPQNLVCLTSALDAANIPYTYSQGYHYGDTDEAMLRHAAATAKGADRVLLVLGLPDAYECEGYDRPHLRLPACHLRLLETVTAANPNVCVLLCGGGPILTPWLPSVRALLCLHLGGEAIGDAAVRLLWGQANPSGKLAETWPLALEDTPSYHHFPMGPTEVTYNESIFVGYRYYDTAAKDVQFPFGYGLSYTAYAYSDLHLETASLAQGQALRARFTVTNTGSMAGEEICQLYVAHKGSATWQPAQELKAFARVALQPGQSRQITLEVPYQTLSFTDAATSLPVVEGGSYEARVGAHSRDLPLSAAFTVRGVSLSPAPAFAADGYYGHIADNLFPEEDFLAIYPGPLLGNTPVQKGSYTLTTTLGEMQASGWGRFTRRMARFVARRTIRFSTDMEANRHAADSMTEDLPLRNVVWNTWGHVSPAAANALLSLCNGKGGFWRFVRELLRRKSYRK